MIRFSHQRLLWAWEGLDVRPVEPEVWPVRDEGPREGGMGRARHGVVTAGDFREKKAGRPCRIVSDSDGLPVDGHGARSLRAAQRDAGYATSIIPDSAALIPGYAGSSSQIKGRTVSSDPFTCLYPAMAAPAIRIHAPEYGVHTIVSTGHCMTP